MVRRRRLLERPERAPRHDGRRRQQRCRRRHGRSLARNGHVRRRAGRARFITGVVNHRFGPGQSHNQVGGFPEALYGPPHAGNPASVVSLGNGGYVVVEFAGNAIIDGPDVDFTVFENPFGNFRELATVAVSEDGLTWHEFPCTAGPGAIDFGYCAGVNPVLSRPGNGVNPLESELSGGDTYDLRDIGVTRRSLRADHRSPRPRQRVRPRRRRNRERGMPVTRVRARELLELVTGVRAREAPSQLLELDRASKHSR